MKNENIGILSISIQGNWNIIRIGKKVIRALGNPEYICLRVNEAMDSVAILPCKSNDMMSFKVPPGFTGRTTHMFRIHSKAFVKEILEINGLNPEISYVLRGTYSETQNAVIFAMADARIPSQDK